MSFPMFSQPQRLETFKLTRKIAKTPTAKTLTLSVKWPHPKMYNANPQTLAEAGFYWNPNATARDNVTCFLCKEDFSDWEMHHDPHVMHYDRCWDSKCAWAIARCGLIAVDSDANRKFRMGNDPNRLPCSKFLETERYKTFIHGDWPHDKSKGHTATSRRMAGAGFIFTPHELGDDTVKCFYCGIELSGWDPDDNPVDEHRRRIAKRGTECPFFTARITELPDNKKTVRKTTSKASLQLQKSTRARPTKASEPEPDSDDQEENLGRSTRSRTAKTMKTPARGSGRSAAASRSRTTASIAETDDPSESDLAEIMGPKAGSSKRRTKEEMSNVEGEDESEGIASPPRKSTRAKKTRGVIEDIEAEVNFEESRPRQAQPRKSKRSRSRVRAGDSDSDVSIKSVRSTRSTRSTKGTASKSKKKMAAKPVVEEEEEMATPVQKLKNGTRSAAPPRSTRGQKYGKEGSIESESSGLLPTPPPKPPKPAHKSRKKVIESESEDWQSAQEDVAPTPRPSTTKKARGRPPKVAKTPKAPPKPPPVPPSPAPTSDTSHVPGSYVSESELHIPVRDDLSTAKKPSAKSAIQPFYEKPSNRSAVLDESRTQPPPSSRLLSIGSKENADDRTTIVIDTSDDDDSRRPVAPRSNFQHSASLSPSKDISSPIAAVPKPKHTLAQKRDSFIGVVVEPSPRMLRQSARMREKVTEGSGVDMDVDKVAVLDQPSGNAEMEHDSLVFTNKGKGKAAATTTKPKPLERTSKQKRQAVVQSEASDSAMDVDDDGSHKIKDVHSTRDSRQPSTPRRDPPKRLLEDNSNPFAAAPSQVGSTDAASTVSAFEEPYGRVPAEVIYALAEEEKEMTVEEWTKRELEIQLEVFKEHGLRRIREFKERAAEARRRIEAL